MRARDPGRVHNVPAEVTSFVGRRGELADLKRRLASGRLLTLVGPGGVGKTRLALRGASEVARSFADGVWFVELSPIREPPLVLQAVFRGLGLQDTSAEWPVSRLAEYLGPRQVLLVLDNCEHVLDSAAVLVSSLLRACPRLRVLATSRQPLAVDGEAILTLEPLRAPDDAADPAHIVEFEAVALLVDRARAADPTFDAGAQPDVVARLCRRLDGLPLALELAASRLGSMDIGQLDGSLARQPLALGGRRGVEDRQRTLEAAIDWSYQLLPEDERRLWADLSVFAGGFDAEAVGEVCAMPDEAPERIVALLADLVDRSILRRDAAPGGSRYVLSETLRAFGRQRLQDRGRDEAVVVGRHRAWVRRLVARATAWDSTQATAFRNVDLESTNVWAALEACRADAAGAAIGIEMCQALYAYWNSRGPLSDARRMVVSLVDLLPADAARATGLWLAAGLAAWQGDLPAARSAAEESLRIARRLDDSALTAWALGHLGVVAWVERRSDEARSFLAAALAAAERAGSAEIGYWVTSVSCAVELAASDPARALVIGDDVVAIGRASGELWARGIVLGFVADARWRLGDPDGAVATLREAIACKAALDDHIGLASRLESLAWILVERGQAEAAAVLIGCATRLRERIGPIFPAFRERHEAALASALEQLGPAGYARAMEVGGGLTAEEAVAYALDHRPPDQRRSAGVLSGRAASTVADASTLTRRELEVAGLVGRGLTNKEIAAELVISERTAETHVWNIFNKLGFNTRSQIAAWAAAREI